MATKIILGKRPGPFKATVMIPIVGAEPAPVQFTFKYRTRKEYAKLIDDTIAEAKAQAAAEIAAAQARAVEEKAAAEAKKESGDTDGEEVVDQKPAAAAPNFEQVIGQSVEADADWVLLLAEDWDLAEEFDRESVITLLDMYGGASHAISAAYAGAINQGRTGN